MDTAEDPAVPIRTPAPEGLPDNGPEPALSLPKGRKSWVSATRNTPSPGGTARSNGANVERTLLSAAFDFALGFCLETLLPERTGKGPASAVPPIVTQDAGFSP